MNRRLVTTRRSDDTKWRSVAPTEPEPSADPPTTDPAPAPPAGKTYTQSDIDRIATREKDQGRRSGESTVLSELGFQSVEEAKNWTEQRRQEEAAKLTEAERQQREAEAAAAQAAADRAQAAADRMAAKTERALTRAGVDEKALDDALRLVSIAPDADDEAINAAVEALKGRLPALFQTAQAAPPAPSGGPQGTPPRPAQNGDAYQRGVERAKALSGAGSA